MTLRRSLVVFAAWIVDHADVGHAALGFDASFTLLAHARGIQADVAHVLPRASRCPDQDLFSPNVFCSPSSLATRSPAASVSRSTVDSLNRSPHSFWSVTSADCAKLVCTPAMLATSLAAGVRVATPNPSA